MRIEHSLSRALPVTAFGRKRVAAATVAERSSTLTDDLKLFTLTFFGGFLFVSLYLA